MGASQRGQVSITLGARCFMLCSCEQWGVTREWIARPKTYTHVSHLQICCTVVVRIVIEVFDFIVLVVVLKKILGNQSVQGEVDSNPIGSSQCDSSPASSKRSDLQEPVVLHIQDSTVTTHSVVFKPLNYLKLLFHLSPPTDCRFTSHSIQRCNLGASVAHHVDIRRCCCSHLQYIGHSLGRFGICLPSLPPVPSSPTAGTLRRP